MEDASSLCRKANVAWQGRAAHGITGLVPLCHGKSIEAMPDSGIGALSTLLSQCGFASIGFILPGNSCVSEDFLAILH